MIALDWVLVAFLVVVVAMPFLHLAFRGKK